MEWFREIDDFPNYNVSNMGRVMHLFTEEIVVPRETSEGFVVRLRNLHEYPMLYIHDLVAEAFIGPIPELCMVAHIDGNKYNNIPSNLRFVAKHPGFRRRHYTTRDNNRSISVRIVETGRTFPSIKEAAKAMGVHHSHISHHLRGDRPNIHGVTFEYATERSA